MIDLGDRIDAAQRDDAIGGRIRRVEEQLARSVIVERVAVVTLARDAVVEMAFASWLFEIVERCSQHWTAAAG